jgi:8-oxo-dGTP diphosphatase
MLPHDEYVASLARKRMGAAALIRDQAGQVLLVDPVYRDTWGLPGGAVEAEESPQLACRREVAEELGLDRPTGRILAVDWIPSRPELPEGLIIIYDGGTLTASEVSAIRVPADELAGFALVPAGRVAERVKPLLARQVSAALAALGSDSVASLENGYPSNRSDRA